MTTLTDCIHAQIALGCEQVSIRYRDTWLASAPARLELSDRIQYKQIKITRIVPTSQLVLGEVCKIIPSVPAEHMQKWRQSGSTHDLSLNHGTTVGCVSSKITSLEHSHTPSHLSPVRLITFCKTVRVHLEHCHPPLEKGNRIVVDSLVGDHDIQSTGFALHPNFCIVSCANRISVFCGPP